MNLINTLKKILDPVILLFGLIMACFPVLPNAAISISGGLWGIVVTLRFLLDIKKGVDRDKVVHLLLFSSVFLLYWLGLWHTSDMETGSTMVLRKIPLFTLPLSVFLYSHFSTKKGDNYLKNAFILSVVIYTALVTGMLFAEAYQFASSSKWGGTFYDLLVSEGFEYMYRITHSQLTHTHTVYSGLFYALTILLLVDVAFKLKNKLHKQLMVLPIGLMLVSLGLLGSRSALLGVIISVIIYIVLNLDSWKKKVTASITVVILACITIALIPTIRQRVMETVTTNLTIDSLEEHNSTNVRVGILHCVKDVLLDHWLWGAGTGDVQGHLNDCYNDLGAEILIKDQYNSHNEYLNMWLSVGILGLIVFIASLLYPLWKAWNAQNYLYISFLVLMMICFLTENILSRQDGIVLFGFFNAFLAFRKT